MSIFEIIFGVVLIAAAIIIILVTLLQEQKGQGLSSAIMGDSSLMGAGRGNSNEQKLATITKVCGAVLFVVTLVICVLSARL